MLQMPQKVLGVINLDAGISVLSLYNAHRYVGN